MRTLPQVLFDRLWRFAFISIIAPCTMGRCGSCQERTLRAS